MMKDILTGFGALFLFFLTATVFTVGINAVVTIFETNARVQAIEAKLEK